jgi:hypothetical protein
MAQYDPVRTPGFVCVADLDIYEHNVFDPELSGRYFDYFVGDQYRFNRPCRWNHLRRACLVHIDLASN